MKNSFQVINELCVSVTDTRVRASSITVNNFHGQHFSVVILIENYIRRDDSPVILNVRYFLSSSTVS